MQEFKYCPSCGGQNNATAQFCQTCGAQYGGASPAPVKEPRKGSTLGLTGTLILCFFGCCIVSGIINSFKGSKTTPSTSVGVTSSPAPISADTSLADSLADNLAIVFAEAASRDATGITARGGTEIHVHIRDMKDFEFRRLQAGTLAGIRLWMKKHSAELSRTNVQKICVNNGPLMGLSICEAR